MYYGLIAQAELCHEVSPAVETDNGRGCDPLNILHYGYYSSDRCTNTIDWVTVTPFVSFKYRAVAKPLWLLMCGTVGMNIHISGVLKPLDR